MRDADGHRAIATWGNALRYNYYTTGTLRSGPWDDFDGMDGDSLTARLAEGAPLFLIDETPMDTGLKTALVRWTGGQAGKMTRARGWLEQVRPGSNVQLVQGGSFPVYRICPSP